MAFKVRKRLEINRAAPGIKAAKRQIENCERTIAEQRAARTRYKLKLAPLKKEYLCLDSVPKTNWPFLQAAGGSTSVADQLKDQISRGFSRLAADIVDYERRIRRIEEEIIAEMLANLQQAKFRLHRAESMPNAIVTLDTDKLDSDLSVCDDYVNGSIKLKIHEEWLAEDTYRITYQTPQLIARCARGSNEAIVISPINVDITIGDRNHGVKFRSVNGLSKRYGGYDGSEVLHPHMTSTSQPCLGDFSGPVQDASEDYDIVTLVTLVGMFLRQFDPEDPAGRRFYHWPQYVPEPVSYIDSYPQRPDSYPQRPDSVNTQLIDEMLDGIFADEDRCESDYADEYVRSN